MGSNATLSTIAGLIKSMKTRKASKYDFIVHVDSKGFRAPDGETCYYCGVPYEPDGTPNDVTTLFYGLCAYNSAKPVNIGHWSTAVQGVGVALIGKTNQTGFSYLYPLKSESAEGLYKELKGIFHSFDKKWISKTFSKEMISDLRQKYKDAFQSYNTRRKIWNKGDPSNCISEYEWIDKGYPCTYREGLAWKGAKSSFITRNEALKKLGHTFREGFERKDGIWVLNFQDYSENDLY